jgi:peroxiredoxin
MAIKEGDALPNVQVTEMVDGKPTQVSLAELTKGKRAVLFAVPGAFTPTCHAKHLPGFVTNAQAIQAKGISDIFCLAVNDAFVMDAWGRAGNAGGKVRMLADGNGALTKALGLEMDATGFGMGQRSQRYAMVIRDGKVEALLKEPGPGLNASSAESVLQRL